MPSMRTLALVLVVFQLSACDQGAVVPQQSEINKSIRQQVLSFVETARESPDQGPTELEMLIESIEGYEDMGDEQFVQLQDSAEQLEIMYRQQASQAAISKQLDRLEAQANALTTAGE
jgi:hypothetical protein